MLSESTHVMTTSIWSREGNQPPISPLHRQAPVNAHACECYDDMRNGFLILKVQNINLKIKQSFAIFLYLVENILYSILLSNAFYTYLYLRAEPSIIEGSACVYLQKPFKSCKCLAIKCQNVRTEHAGGITIKDCYANNIFILIFLLLYIIIPVLSVWSFNVFFSVFTCAELARAKQKRRK